MRHPRFRISTLVMLIVIVAMALALVVQQARMAQLEIRERRTLEQLSYELSNFRQHEIARDKELSKLRSQLAKMSGERKDSGQIKTDH